ncbi:30S ribosome-binding factor RbfA [Pseudodesulfovibrio tunisiensis]|uniref:30S ribosome-binding factor RbfA n=1 Tax=Pseudodesulfovibrio tunisiensis TaxID=463192 RepID=UPI001FB41520|nr:30S ribosome-binding factor RbfA [Pseudodesulfovibrio tunisiensis]
MKVSDSRRAARLGDQIMREVSSMLVEEVQDPRLMTVTLTGVRMNANLRVAEILYSAASGEDREEIQKGLKKASGFLRSNLGKRLKLRFVPELRFAYDEFLEDVVYGKPTGRN